jgi:hypothetical protein
MNSDTPLHDLISGLQEEALLVKVAFALLLIVGIWFIRALYKYLRRGGKRYSREQISEIERRNRRRL